MTSKELATALQNAKVNLSMTDLLSIINEFDESGDGTVSQEEFIAMMKKCSAS